MAIKQRKNNAKGCVSVKAVEECLCTLSVLLSVLLSMLSECVVLNWQIFKAEIRCMAV